MKKIKRKVVMTQGINHIYDNGTKEEKAQITSLFRDAENQYKHYKKEIEPASMAASWHVAFDESQKAKILDKAKNISCKKGCSHCCSMPVVVSEDEVKLLAWLVQNQDIKIDNAKLSDQASVMEADSKDLMTLAIKDRECVFLDTKKGECRIYNQRPLSCRNYLVTSPPEDCNNANERGGGVDYVAVVIVDIAIMAAWNSGTCGYLQPMLLKELTK